MNAWGVSRQTGDVDLLIPERWRGEWKRILADIGYKDFHEQGGFVQYAAPDPGSWPLDLLVVNDDTFDRIHEQATVVRFGQTECPVACPEHLLAMKFHALRYVPEIVALKYLSDIHALVRKAEPQVPADRVRELCLRYGSEEIYERLTALGRREP